MYLRTFIIFAYKTRASILEMKCCHKLVFILVLMHEFLKGKQFQINKNTEHKANNECPKRQTGIVYVICLKFHCIAIFADAIVCLMIDYRVEQYGLFLALYVTVYRSLFGYIGQPSLILDYLPIQGAACY